MPRWIANQKEEGKTGQENSRQQERNRCQQEMNSTGRPTGQYEENSVPQLRQFQGSEQGLHCPQGYLRGSSLGWQHYHKRH